MTNFEKLQSYLAHHPAILAELNRAQSGGGMKISALFNWTGPSRSEWDNKGEVSNLIDKCMLWGDTPQGQRYWNDVFDKDLPLVPKRCWVDVFGVMHTEVI